VKALAAILWLLAAPAWALCDGPTRVRPIPIPIYSTLPNEGSTYGFMPVFLHVCEKNERTESILAPSLSWNDTIHWTATIRSFNYPSDTETFMLVVSASTRINSNVLVRWDELTKGAGQITRELELRFERSVFYRFFGIGADTPAENESSYTRIRAHANGRFGLNFAPDWNAGVTLAFHRDVVQDIGIAGLPLSRREFPGVPGMGGSATFWQGLDLRYDSRPNREYSDRGIFLDGNVSLVEGLLGSPVYGRAGVSLRGLLPELSWLSGAARVDASFVSSGGAPFYEQSTLGGSFLLRGYTFDRFIDENSWTAEAEERVRLLQLKIFGVVADVRIDPFVAVGQVYGGVRQAFASPHVTTGLGFRAFVHPNVLGRVDLATGGEGLDIYVELGYPY
jgi:outer membrane protein assembly factor BamA